jgi:hypothetical protein
VARILDIDLDFFVQPVVHWPEGDARAESGEHSVWSVERAVDFLTTQCRLESALPGFLTETHDEVFYRWRDAVEAGTLTPPFHVTHIDAHADLGLGDSGYMFLMTSLLFDPPERRWYPSPPPGVNGLNEANFLLYAIACRWIGSLEYVFGEGGGSDELFCVMEGFDLHADRIQLAAMTDDAMHHLLISGSHGQTPPVSHLEPAIDYESGRWQDFYAEGPYDMVCLTRSPLYAPATADSLYDAIAAKFIEPMQFTRAESGQ